MDLSPPPAPEPRRARRALRMFGGFVLVLAGIPLLVLPGPGMPAIYAGLMLLSADFPWAARLLARLRAGTDELQRRLFGGPSGLFGLGRARGMASAGLRRLARRRPRRPRRSLPHEPGPPKDG